MFSTKQLEIGDHNQTVKPKFGFTTGISGTLVRCYYKNITIPLLIFIRWQ